MLLYNYTTFLLVYSVFNNEYVQKNIKSGVFDTKPPNKGHLSTKAKRLVPEGGLCSEVPLYQRLYNI